ncbi:MAG: hypothetical protein IIW86_02625 [Clostridia bacterium]|nr:hypothetical protein [Clostridia bacterium]
MEEKFIYLNGWGYVKCSAIISIREKWVQHNHYVCYLSLSNGLVLQGSVLIDPANQTFPNHIGFDNVLETLAELCKNRLFYWRVLNAHPLE